MNTTIQLREDEHSGARIAPRQGRSRWRMPWVEAVAAAVILVGTLVLLYPTIASWFSQLEQSRVTATALEMLDEPPHDDDQFRANQFAAAHAYNAALASGAVFRANENVVSSDGAGEGMTFVYEDLLNPLGAGFMGRLRYEALDIDLPIYHGTSEHTLAMGVGHLEGTSLPVGGLGTRSVLTAHRGLPQATLFNELDRARVGDTFTVAVLDQVLSYRVVDTLVIEPDQTEAIIPVQDRDLVTLVTCTPLGINSHRILVNAERVTPTPVAAREAAVAAPDLPGFAWWAVALGAVVVGTSAYVWHAGRRRSEVLPQ